MRHFFAAPIPRVLLGSAHVALGATVLTAALMAQATTARAYTNFADYGRPIEEGGGGGRFFSGSPGDPYTCDVCHGGGEPADFQVNGLPLDGYEPGRTYTISFGWGEEASAVAMMAEFTDRFGDVAGTTSLLPSAERRDEAFCFGGASPALDVCRVEEDPACCRRVDPFRDECSFPGERSVLWMRDCGSDGPLRARWTAPESGDVWFSASLVRSDKEQDVGGDGVTLVRTRLRAAGSPPERLGAQGDCRVSGTGTLARGGKGTLFVLGLPIALAALARNRRSVRALRGRGLSRRNR